MFVSIKNSLFNCFQLYPEGSPGITVTSHTVLNVDTWSEMPTPLLFELNLIGISSIGVFNLWSVATYRPVEIPQYGVTMGPATDTSAAILLTIGMYEEQYSCLMLSYNPISTDIISCLLMVTV